MTDSSSVFSEQQLRIRFRECIRESRMDYRIGHLVKSHENLSRASQIAHLAGLEYEGKTWNNRARFAGKLRRFVRGQIHD